MEEQAAGSSSRCCDEGWGAVVGLASARGILGHFWGHFLPVGIHPAASLCSCFGPSRLLSAEPVDMEELCSTLGELMVSGGVTCKQNVTRRGLVMKEDPK